MTSILKDHAIIFVTDICILGISWGGHFLNNLYSGTDFCQWNDIFNLFGKKKKNLQHLFENWALMIRYLWKHFTSTLWKHVQWYWLHKLGSWGDVDQHYAPLWGWVKTSWDRLCSSQAFDPKQSDLGISWCSQGIAWLGRAYLCLNVPPPWKTLLAS